MQFVVLSSFRPGMSKCWENLPDIGLAGLENLPFPLKLTEGKVHLHTSDSGYPKTQKFHYCEMLSSTQIYVRYIFHHVRNVFYQ